MTANNPDAGISIAGDCRLIRSPLGAWRRWILGSGRRRPAYKAIASLNRAASPLAGTHRVACSGRAETYGESSRITRHVAPNDGGDDEPEDHSIPDNGIRQPDCSTGAARKRDPVRIVTTAT